MKKPRNLKEVLAGFEEAWSPRIVARVNDYDVRVARVVGEHVWHAHDHTDEFFLVLDGTLKIELRSPEGRKTEVLLQAGDTFVVPRGVEHKPSSPGGSILMFEPTGTLTTGDHPNTAPAQGIETTSGHDLQG